MIKNFEQYNQQLCESLRSKDTFEDSVEKYKKLIETYQKFLSKCEVETLPETKEKKIAIGKEIYDILNNDYYNRNIKLDKKIVITNNYHLDRTKTVDDDCKFYGEGLYISDFFAISNGNCNMVVTDGHGFSRGNKNFIDHVSLKDCERILEFIKKKVDRSIKARERFAKSK
jgi:hypothetical protein